MVQWVEICNATSSFVCYRQWVLLQYSCVTLEAQAIEQNAIWPAGWTRRSNRTVYRCIRYFHSFSRVLWVVTWETPFCLLLRKPLTIGMRSKSISQDIHSLGREHEFWRTHYHATTRLGEKISSILHVKTVVLTTSKSGTLSMNPTGGIVEIIVARLAPSWTLYQSILSAIPSSIGFSHEHSKQNHEGKPSKPLKHSIIVFSKHWGLAWGQ